MGTSRRIVVLSFLAAAIHLPISGQPPGIAPAFQEYLSNPYSVVRANDIGFQGGLTYIRRNGGLLPQGVDHIYLNKAVLVDVDGDKRADLVVPMSGSHIGTFLVIFYNKPTGGSVDVSALDPAIPWELAPAFRQGETGPAIQPLSLSDEEQFLWDVSTSNSKERTVVLDGDLNGDGVPDRITVSLTPPDITRRGQVLRITEARLNFGPVKVPERYVRQAIFDMRLGYLAAVVQTFSKAGVSTPGFNRDQFNNTVGTLLSAVNDSLAAISEKVGQRDLVDNSAKAAKASLPDLDDALNGLKRKRGPDDKLNGLLHTYPEIDFNILYARSYVPDNALYLTGLRSGIAEGAQEVNLVANVRTRAPIVAALARQVGGAGGVNAETDLTQATRLDQTLDEERRFMESGGATLVADSSLLSFFSVEMDSSGAALTVTKVAAKSADRIASVQLTAEMVDTLDQRWIIPKPDGRSGVINASRILGSATAFYTLMVMRAQADYLPALKESPGRLNATGVKMAGSFGPSLRAQLNRPQILEASAIQFVSAAVASGYSDLTIFIGNDIFEQGRLEGQKEALSTLKSYFGGQVPGLGAVNTVDAAAQSISVFLGQQQQEIAGLKQTVSDLNDTIASLKAALDNANALIKNLNDASISAKNTFEKLGKTADAVTTLAKAGTGAIIAGPIGAAICALFC